MKILWIVRQDLSCYVFYFVKQMFVSSYGDFLELTFSMTYLTQKHDFWTHLWNFKYYENLLIKGQ